MLVPYVLALKDTVRTLMLIGALATGGAAVLILGLGMDTPWAPWERDSDVMFPPVLFTLATFVATVAFCAGTVVYHTLLKSMTNDADKWWRISGRRIFACIRFVLVRIWNVSSRNHAQSSASHRRNSGPHPHTTRSQKQAEQYGPNLSKG